MRKRGFESFKKDFKIFSEHSESEGRDKPLWDDIKPILFEKTIATEFDKHYVYHTAWAIRILKKINPAEHIDISSSLFFSAMASAFFPIKFYDYRPAKIVLDNLTSGAANLLDLPFNNDSIKSLSCMHVIEHLGLGRYNDPIDSLGDVKGINELKRVLSKGGYLLFVTPVGKPKIAFNAHRIYSYKKILKYFSPLVLEEFALISTKNYETGLILDASPEEISEEEYGCGCFLFKKV